jgi:hypothetical protein
MTDQNSPIFVNSQFVNNGGDPIINTGGATTFYVNCHFSFGAQGASFLSGQALAEACTFDLGGRSSAVNTSIVSSSSWNSAVSLYNSQSTGVPLGAMKSGILLNTILSSNPTLNYAGVLLQNFTSIVFLPGAPIPSPQYLVFTANITAKAAPATTGSDGTTAGTTGRTSTTGALGTTGTSNAGTTTSSGTSITGMATSSHTTGGRQVSESSTSLTSSAIVITICLLATLLF